MRYLFVLFSIILMSACNQEAGPKTLEHPSPVQEISESDAGLSMEITDAAYSGSPAEIEAKLKNESTRSFEYGDYYYIEVEKDDGWFILTHSDAVFIRNPNLVDQGYILAPNTAAHQRFSVDVLGVELPAGEYRLVKTFISQQEPYEEIALASPFTVK